MNNQVDKNPLSTYFDSNIRFLKFTGFWVYDDKIQSLKTHFQHVYNTFCCFYMFIFYLPAEVLYVFYSFDNFNLFLRTVRDIGNHSFLAYKAFNYFRMRKDLMNLMYLLQNGNYDYEEQDDFRPRMIIETEKKQAEQWTKYFLYFCNAIVTSMFLVTLHTFFFLSESQYKIENNVRVYTQQQPVHTVSMFGYGTRSKFVLTFIYTIIALPFLAWMIVALDSLFITLMSCVSAHLKILQGAFKNIRIRCIKRLKIDVKSTRNILYDPPELQNEINKEMIKCVNQLQVVLRVSQKLETIYSTQTFIQTLISLGEICFCLYLLSENVNQEIGNESAYLMATGFEFLMYCWFGNRITEASIQLKYALYDGDWFSTSLSFRKLMIFTMTRMQRPIHVTIGKITPLTFSTFLTIARAAYTFFAFLKQRQGLIRQTGHF